MQDGKNDHVVPTEPYGTFYAGSWPINNQVMLEAFQSAGYDVKLVMGDEGHNMKQGAAIMPEALRWLWRGYPSPDRRRRNPPDIGKPGWDPRGKVYSTVSADKTMGAGGRDLPLRDEPRRRQRRQRILRRPAANRIYKSDARPQGDRIQGQTPTAPRRFAWGRTAACTRRNRRAAHRVLRSRRRRK